jgi:hypothetical protein
MTEFGPFLGVTRADEPPVAVQPGATYATTGAPYQGVPRKSQTEEICNESTRLSRTKRQELG